VALSYCPSSIRDEILEAVRLHRILRFLYEGLERVVEPYSLIFKRRQDGAGREYFYGWDLSGGRSGMTGIKSYIAGKIHAPKITDQTFEPRELINSERYFNQPYFSSPRTGAFRSPTSNKWRRSTGSLRYTVISTKTSLVAAASPAMIPRICSGWWRICINAVRLSATSSPRSETRLAIPNWAGN
jgi:WYL domain